MEKSYYSLRNYKKELILGPLFKVIEVIFELIVPFLMKYIINEGIEYANNGNIWHIIIPGLIIILFCILGFCSTYVCQYFASIASQGFGTDLRNRIYQKVLSLSLSDVENLGKSNLINLINNDSNRLQLSVAMLIRLVIRAPVLVIGSLICSFIINVKIGLIFLAIVPLILLILGIIIYFNSRQYLKVQKSVDGIITYTNDSLNGARVIRAFNTKDISNKKYEDLTNDYFKESKKANLVAALVNPLTFLIVDVAIALVIYFGGNLIYKGNLTDGDLVALISYLNQIFVALVVVTNLVVIFTKAFSSKKRVDALLTKEETIKNNPIYKDIKIDKGDTLIFFDNVDFKYENAENNVVSNITFEIKKGETIGIIGGTGSGKTTLIKLMERFYDTSNGSIYYKGHNIKEYDIKCLRDEISLVNQTNVLFNGSIKSNLLMGNKNATLDEMTTALKEAEAYEFVNKYDDYIDHEVLENGKNFSGGQKQRLCLARSLVKKSQLLILDDSTSALDYITDFKVRENISKIDDLTTIIISQRTSSIHNADKIIVMDNGKIDAIGTHEELLNSSILYKEIYDSQVKEKEHE